MGLYDTIMRRGSDPAAPGAGAVTDPLAIDTALPDMTPDLYEQVYGTLPASTDVPTYGADSRGPAMHQEDITAVGGKAGKIVRAAKSLLGTPYVWGGTTSKGIDCSGLVQLAFKAAGINLPRVSYQQLAMGKRVPLDQLQPGDLVGWDNSSRNPGIDHISIYLGGGLIIEAPAPGEHVRIRKLGSGSGAVASRVL